MGIGRLGLTTLLLASCAQGICQNLMSLKPRQPIVCYANPIDQHTAIGAPKESQRGTGARTKTATFEVTYKGFTPQAQAAFQAAVNIWSNLLTSSQTIHVEAVWQPLEPGVLGSAIWGGVYANFPGAQNVNTYYPVALAEKMAGKDLNLSSDPDIHAEFNSTMNWDYGLTGNPASNKYDLVTAVLHELGHGLGFVDSYTINSSGGEVGVRDTDIPLIYDVMLENNSGFNLYENFPAPPALEAQLISEKIFYNSPQVLANTAGNRAKIYAPPIFKRGSSISHVDEDAYPAGNINSLMSPQIGSMESIHDPGPIVKAAFSDMGWIFTFIKHTKLPNTENINGPYVVKTTIISEAGPVSQINLFYSSGSLADTKVTMTATGNPNEYSAVIPGTHTPNTYRYYISAQDNLARKFTSPGKLLSPGKNAAQYYNVFVAGPDITPPRITHVAKSVILNTELSLKIEAIISDNIGIENARVEYKINDVDQTPLSLIPGQPDSLYAATIDFGSGLNIGDKIKYRIIATDNSSNHNSRTSPENGYYEVNVTGLKATQVSYINNFSVPSNDFFGDGFSITTPFGFVNGAIHSEHPYLEGNNFPGNIRNTSYELLVPIKVKSHDATITFDEIVLVEPGSTGTKFGDPNFFDYVIVEGSKDRGATWSPVADGYDSRDDSAWLTRFNSAFSGNNSSAVGDSSLYRKRTLNLLDHFHAGDEVIIRFRLFSDNFAAGWGWAIDNLNIQFDIPVVLNDHVDYILPGTSSLPIITKATDSDGIKDLSVEYQVNSVPSQTHSFVLLPGVNQYTFNPNLSNVSAGDTIHYRIIATDSTGIQGTFPPVGLISTYVLKTGSAVTRYVNDFNSPSNDFIGNFFEIKQPPGFTDASVNSNHFYHNGMGVNHTSNYSYILTKPIIINPNNPYIHYDEIVIVEGHSPNSSFGNVAFNDYVTVDGSIDGGKSWKTLVNGYDAEDQSSWKASFIGMGIGSPALYKPRKINFLERSGFHAGDTLLVRFRLFANESLNGWGWSIDNLSIQGPVTAVEYSQQDYNIVLYPNPASEKINIHANAAGATYMKLSLINLQGRVLFSYDVVPDQNVFDYELGLTDLSPGLYLLKVETQDTVCTKTFLKY